MLVFKLCILFLIFVDIFGDNVKDVHFKVNRSTRGPWTAKTIEWTATTKPSFVFNEITATGEPNTTTGSLATTAESTTPNPLTTIEDPTTKNEDSTTTKVSSTTTLDLTAPLPVCKSSLHSKTDLQLIIDYNMNYVHINDDNFEEHIKSHRDFFMKDIEYFRHWFMDRPEHLLHVLDELKKKRHTLEPALEEISNLFDMLPSLQEEFNNRNISADQIFRNLKKYNHICALNCGDNIIVERTKSIRTDIPFDPKEYYCGSIKDIQTMIFQQLTMYTQQLKIDMEIKLNEDCLDYQHKIDKVKDRLKEIALKEFGRTMYDILNLQDEYAHYEAILKNTDIRSNMNKARQAVAQLYPRLLSLEATVEKYGKFCRVCQSKPVSQTLKYSVMENTDNSYESNNLLDELIQEKKKNIEELVLNEYSKLLKPLEDKIIEANNSEEYLKDLKELQHEVVEATEIENKEYEHLKSKIAPSVFVKLSRLERESAAMLKKIETYTNQINKILV